MRTKHGNNTNGSRGSKGSYDDILQSPPPYDKNSTPSTPDTARQKRMKEKDRKGRLIVNTSLKNHHSTSHHDVSSPAAAFINAGADSNSKKSHPNMHSSENNNNHNNNKPTKNAKKLDEYGFIVNIDEKGTIRNEDSFYVSGGATTPALDHTNGGENINVNVNNKIKHGKNIMRRRKNNQQQGSGIGIGKNKRSGISSPDDVESYPSIPKSPSDPTSSSSNKNYNHYSSSNKSQQNHPTSPNRLSRIRNKRQKLQLLQRRENKWNQMITNYKDIISSKPKLKKLHLRVRKGIPNSMRGKAWVTMAQVDIRIKAMTGVYADLVEQTCTDKIANDIRETSLSFAVNSVDGENGNNHNRRELNVQEKENNGNSIDPTADIMKETIERDINRTYPRHSMFYDSYSDSDDNEEEEEEGEQARVSGTKAYNDELSDESYDQVSFTGSLDSAGQYTTDMANLIQGLDSLDTSENFQPPQQHPGGSSDDNCWTKPVRAIQKATVICPPIPCVDSKTDSALVCMKSPPFSSSNNTPARKEKKKVDFTTEEGGQASLRRVLRAYSLYDPEVGYCQGMNFIAGMFITFVTEEEAFWLLVYVMNAKPCRMRGLFGEGMSEAHQVLYVAEKLIAQFNPKLFKHFHSENIHVTMFATQWLLTMYTSSFPFHIVTRVWDCFILEGWKVAYRAMLALLEMATPDLLKLRFEDILNYFKIMPFQVNVDTLFVAMFNVPLKKRHIEKYAKEWLRTQKTEKIAKQKKRKNR